MPNLREENQTNKKPINLAQKLKKVCEMKESCSLYSSSFFPAAYTTAILYLKPGKFLK